MPRVQLALNVGDLDAAIEHYSRMFRTAPAKVRTGYANFIVADPPLKLVLIAGHGEPGTLNHLGVEMETVTDVAETIAYAGREGFITEVEEETTCCHAVQTKVWILDGEIPWEWYVVLADAPQDVSLQVPTPGTRPRQQLPVSDACCGPAECC